MSKAKVTAASIEAQHVLVTGPISGTVTLPDGTVVDVTAPTIAVDDELQAAEIAHAIGLHWNEPGNIHPGQIGQDPETGKAIINDFVYDDSHYQATKKRLTKKKDA